MKKSSWLWVSWILALITLSIMGFIDWVTGYELNFYVFYFLPVSIVAWFFGIFGSIVISVISTVIWFSADFFSDHLYSSTAHIMWNTLIRLISFIAIGLSISKMRYLLDSERETAEALRKSLSEIRVLETFLPICSQCKKIRDDKGAWTQLETYISEHTNTQFSHSYCPNCYNKAMAEAGLIRKQIRSNKTD